jgi:hypothetical protein
MQQLILGTGTDEPDCCCKRDLKYSPTRAKTFHKAYVWVGIHQNSYELVKKLYNSLRSGTLSRERPLSKLFQVDGTIFVSFS